MASLGRFVFKSLQIPLILKRGAQREKLWFYSSLKVWYASFREFTVARHIINYDMAEEVISCRDVYNL